MYSRIRTWVVNNIYVILVFQRIIQNISINKIISQLELEMFEAAKDLRFEEAAKIRDEIKVIKDFNFGINFVQTDKRMAN